MQLFICGEQTYSSKNICYSRHCVILLRLLLCARCSLDVLEFMHMVVK